MNTLHETTILAAALLSGTALGGVTATEIRADPAESASGLPKWKLVGDRHLTAVSGDTGTFQAFTVAEGDFRAMSGLRWWEVSDDPCKLVVEAGHLNNYSIKELAYEACGEGKPGNGKYVARRSSSEYVTALAVCTTDKKDSARDKIKGVRLWGRTLDVTKGTLGPENGPSEAKHTNCKNWRRKVSCPKDQVAVGVKIFSESGGYRRNAVTGLALLCRRIEPK